MGTANYSIVRNIISVNKGENSKRQTESLHTENLYGHQKR